MSKIYYYQQEVKIGDKVDLNGHTVTVTEQLVKDLPDKFKVKNEPNFDELLQEAKRRYPKGAKFKSLDNNSVIRTVKNDDHFQGFPDTYSINCGNTPQDEWEKEDSCSNPEIYRDGQWAEIVKPLFTTKDGVEIYEGDKCWFLDDLVLKNGNNISERNFGIWCGDSESEFNKYFSTREAAEEYIAKHKEKTLGDYESELLSKEDQIWPSLYPEITTGTFYGWVKKNEPKLYWTKVLQLIADDLNDSEKSGKAIIEYDSSLGKYQAIWRTNLEYSYPDVLFISREVAAKAIKIMGDKLDYIYKQ